MKDNKSNSFFHKMATFIVDKRNLFFLLYIFAFIFSIFSMNWVEVASIIEETSIYLTDFDIDDDNVYQLYRQYLLFVQRYNLEVEKINQEFENIFFSNLPSSDPLGG